MNTIGKRNKTSVEVNEIALSKGNFVYYVALWEFFGVRRNTVPPDCLRVWVWASSRVQLDHTLGSETVAKLTPTAR
eukprot:2469231-Amphidinium_carterae.1